MALLSVFSTSQSMGHIMTLYTTSEIQEALSSLEEGTVIFVDVDDTLITPQSKCFHASSPYRDFIDELKKNREEIENFDIILSHWRLQRKIMLVSEGWSQLLRSLKEKYSVYALTKIETGSFGDLPSMEKWRYDELTQKGLFFTPAFKGTFEHTLVCGEKSSSPATFYHGIFMTGATTKGDVVATFVEAQRPTQIVLIDDRQDYLQDVEETCKKLDVPFLGILFRGVDLIKGAPDRAVADFQKQYLLTNKEWLEDDVAAEKLRERSP